MVRLFSTDAIQLTLPIRLAFLAFALLLVVFRAQSQEPSEHYQPVLVESTLVVKDVVVTGNESTKDFVIVREMSLHPGDTITAESIEYDKNRIYSLGLFNRVTIDVVPSGDGHAALEVHVHERWYLYPYPILGIKDRDWSKVYAGLGVIHMNFRGRNEKLIGSCALGYDPWVSVVYRNPFLTSDGAHFLETRIVYTKTRNKSILAQVTPDNFDEHQMNVGLTLGRRWGTAHSAWMSVFYEHVNISDYIAPPTISPDGIDRFVDIGLGYSYDSRDLAEYPNMGSMARLSVTQYGLKTPGLSFARFGADVRTFRPLWSPIVLALRGTASVVAGGEVPSYKRVYFGYDTRIRGHFKEVQEGEQMASASAELHLPIAGPTYVTVDVVPREFSLWRFGIVVAVFADIGTVWNRNEPLALNRCSKGYGGGLHLLLPYSFVLRLEYALNEQRRGEFIVDMGAWL